MRVLVVLVKSSDTEILDWLQEGCDGYFSCERGRDPYVGSPTYGPLDEWTIFTIPSQHVKGNSVRDALLKAMEKAND